MLFVLYNALLAGVDVLTLRRLARERTPAVLALGLGTLAVVGTGLAVLGMFVPVDSRWFGRHFTFLGLLAWGIFGHGIPFLGVAAVLVRARFPLAAVACALAALGLAAAAVEGFWIEPRALEVNHHRIATSAVPRPLRLVVVSDVQTEHPGAFEREVMRRAMQLEPDLLLFPGDYVHTREDLYRERIAALNAILREEGLAAPLGILAVEGNVEREGWTALFDGLEATAVVDTSSLSVGPLAITALSFEDSFDPRLALPARDGFHIVLGHAPDFALGDVRADLLLAGHTHGGQVRLPWLGPPLTLSKVPRAWAAGRTDLGQGRTLIVSRGIGMERGDAPRVRFLCRPEIVVVDLVPEER